MNTTDHFTAADIERGLRARRQSLAHLARLPQLADTEHGTPIKFEHDGRLRAVTFQLIEEWRIGRADGPVSHYVLLLRDEDGQDLRLRTTAVYGVQAIDGPACPRFALNPQTAGAQVERCFCGRRAALH